MTVNVYRPVLPISRRPDASHQPGAKLLDARRVVSQARAEASLARLLPPPHAQIALGSLNALESQSAASGTC